MKDGVCAIMLIGSDDDIAGYTIKHLIAEGFDKIIIDLVPVIDHTAEILYALQAKYPKAIEIIPSGDVSTWGTKRMTKLAAIAHEKGYEWLLPCDADELYFAKTGKLLSDEIRESKFAVGNIPIYNHVTNDLDGAQEVNPYKRIMHRMANPLSLAKVFLKYQPGMIITEGNHAVLSDKNEMLPAEASAVELRHFPYRSPQQFIKKISVIMHAIQETKGYPKANGIHIRTYYESLQRGGEQHLNDWYMRWFHHAGEHEDIVRDPAPYKSN